MQNINMVSHESEETFTANSFPEAARLMANYFTEDDALTDELTVIIAKVALASAGDIGLHSFLREVYAATQFEIQFA